MYFHKSQQIVFATKNYVYPWIRWTIFFFINLLKAFWNYYYSKSIFLSSSISSIISYLQDVEKCLRFSANSLWISRGVSLSTCTALKHAFIKARAIDRGLLEREKKALLNYCRYREDDLCTDINDHFQDQYRNRVTRALAGEEVREACVRKAISIDCEP